ncbi:protein prenyltransferase alpha subunit repeat-containing protein 1 [Phlebotomus argentipes]|uniref:protein prenyltransferase alpha subunit repeat-containing protein 1 n=1 Tax=Phlebotomus argentipes TaxID=94469 RepID=UPI0028933B8D|nr:protein prenyltransferase alpha subunit repeat-containing protein 1 [Phlebotomus argentipes]
MDCGSNPLCERIIGEIDQVFSRDPNLATFEVIPMPSNQNKSPVIHVEHNLGLESWCVKHVYDHCHRVLLDSRLVVHKHSSKEKSCEKSVKYLNVAILINPDVAVFWNMRRNLVRQCKLKTDAEFHFSALVLSKKPKSSEAFAYRRWLYSFESRESIDLAFEISLCERCADRNSSNYHAWSHRLWVLDQEPRFLHFEIYLTEKFIRRHISDYSAYHHRVVVLRKLLQVGEMESEENSDYASLCDLIDCLLGAGVAVGKTPSELLIVLLPNAPATTCLAWSANKQFKSLLHCLNLAAYDLQLTEELRETFGEREAFELHRRSVVQFIVESCRLFDGSFATGHDGMASSVNNCHSPPASKASRRENRFLDTLRRKEAQRSEATRKWCQLFLDFPCDG